MESLKKKKKENLQTKYAKSVLHFLIIICD